MSDDEYEYDDLDNLTALLDEDQDFNPYHDDSQSSAVKKNTPPASRQKSSQRSASEPSPHRRSSKGPRSSQGSFQSAISGSSHRSSSQDQGSCQGQGLSQDQRSSGCDQQETDETKSKDELMDELKRMREQVKVLQSQQSTGGSSQTTGGSSQTTGGSSQTTGGSSQITGGSSQTSQPRETFSDAITVTVPDKHVTKKKTSPADRKASGETRRYSTEEIGSLAGLKANPTLSNPDDGEWFEDEDDEEDDDEERPSMESKSALFSKNNKRVAHTPQNATKKPDKVSPYKCELCKEVLDTLDALNLHMFQHRKQSSQDCPVCGMSFHSKLKLEAHARTHKSSAMPSASTGAKYAKRAAVSKSSGAVQGGRREEVGGRGSGNAKKEMELIETNRHSHIRIVNPLVSSSRLDSMMEGRKMLRLSILQKYLDSGSNEGDWVTMGVIVSKLPPKTSSKGKTFSIWKLSDLSVCDQTVTLFLFGKAHDEHWKTAQGSVVGLLNASVLPPKDNGKDEGVSLSIDHPEKLLILGKSKDFGHCRGRRKDGKACSMVVNMAVSEFCQYHVQTEYKKHSAKRTDLQSSYGGVQPNAFKMKLGTNIIYGGHAYNPVSTSVLGSSSKPGAKTKKKETKVALQSLGVKGAKEIEQEARDSLMTLHGRKNKEDTLIKVSGANEQFKEMLSSPCLGAQNLIHHMVKVEEVSKPVSMITAKDLIKQHQETMRARQASRKHGHKAPSSSSSSSSFTKTKLGESNGRPASSGDLKPDSGRKGQCCQSDAENRTPVLGRGLGEDDDIIFDASSPPQNPNTPRRSALPKRESGKGRSLEEAKRRAIALIRAKGQIAKADPNQVTGMSKEPASPRKRQAVKRRVEEDLNRTLEEDSDAESSGQPAKKPKTSFLGQEVNMSQDEMKAILKAKSSHSGLLAEVQSEMEELYFQQLEKKERLENQMDSIKEKKCKVVSCKKCDYTWFSPSTLCISENHSLMRHEATMRYFKCKNCTSRSITFNRIPNKSCRACGGTSYERTSMLKERKGPVLDSERLLIRGEERKWVM